MGHPGALKGRVGQAESGKNKLIPARGRAARDGRFLPTTRMEVNRNGPFINSGGGPPARSGWKKPYSLATIICQERYIV
jgi:hypothetical protein